jgi:glutamate carboxypeptidase
MPEPDLASIERLAEPLLPRILARTAELVAVDSGSHDPAGVDTVGDLVAGYLGELRFAVTRHAVPGRGHLLDAVLTLDRPGPRVLLLGHADTVWPAGTAAQWPLTSDAGQLRGPAVGDMKCALAMAVSAIEIALAVGVAGQLRYLLIPDEELGSVGSRPLIEAAAREADVCLTLEAGQTGGGVITSRGAVGAVVVTATGRTAHCTEPGGASALRTLAPLVAVLEGLSDPANGMLCSVGILRSGTARQVIPGDGELHADLRAPDDATALALLARVEECVTAAATDGVRLSLEGGLTRPALAPARSAPVYALAEQVTREAGRPVRPIAEKGGSDAGFVAALGIPTLDGLGPVATEQCSRREAVEIASIVPRTALLAALIRYANLIPRPTA